MKSLKCSQCGLVNFADAVVCKRCNCQLQDSFQQTNQAYGAYGQTAPNNAYSYSNSNSYPNQSESSPDASAALRKMFFGALWAIGGTIATVIGYSSAGGGGKYIVFWGAIVFGAVDFFVGLSGWISSKD
ncbi:MAG TPA: hypothetical protein VNB22_00090 [Pyrinomonadaceae bacterium]|nr:hypothetical protein [Pyrinomonadaceae bacterium]